MPTIQYKNAEGKRLKGVTTIKGVIAWGKGALMYWANQQGLAGRTLQESYNTATVPGTIAHYLIECDLKGIESDLARYEIEDVAKANSAYENYLHWRKQFGFKPIAIEPNLVSEQFQYGGTPDVIAEINGVLSLMDWKSGKSAGKYPEIFLQLAGYTQLIRENGYGEISGYHVLRISRDEDIPAFAHFYWEKLPPEAWEAFTYAARLSEIETILKKYL